MRLTLLVFAAAALAACAPTPPFAVPPKTAVAPPVDPTADAPLPNTPAGRFLGEWVHMWNDGTADEIRHFYETRYAPAMNPPGAIQGRVAYILRSRPEDGRRHVRVVEKSSDYAITAVLQTDGTEAWSRQVVRLDPTGAHLVLESAGSPAERPDGFGPKGVLDDAAIAADLDAYVTKLAQRDVFSGAVAVARGDRIIYQRAVGIASRAWNAPMTIDTKMNLGSMNKMFTSIAIAQLAQAGKLSYTDTLAKLVPDYPNKDVAAKITVHQLLTHSSGLGDYFNEQYEKTPKDQLRTIKDYLPLFADKPLLFEPGTKFSYSNAGFMVLGLIVQTVSGEDYFDYVRRHVYEPAGMHDTDAYEMDHDTPNLAIGYTHDDEGAWMNNLYLHVVKGGPAGGGFSTVLDLVRFARALEAGKLVDRAHLELVTTKKIDEDGSEYGYGFGTRPVRGHHGYGHNGGFAGINGALKVLPDLGVTVAALSNRDPPAAERVVERALDLVTQK